MQSLAEKVGEGLVFRLYSKIARDFNSYLVGGYLEMDKERKEICYNSMYMLDREGKLVTNYRKVFLYGLENDYLSPGFDRPVVEINTLEGQKVRAALGICLDIDVATDKPESAYQFATYYRDLDIDIVLFITAWCWDDESQFQ